MSRSEKIPSKASSSVGVHNLLQDRHQVRAPASLLELVVLDPQVLDGCDVPLRERRAHGGVTELSPDWDPIAASAPLMSRPRPKAVAR